MKIDEKIAPMIIRSDEQLANVVRRIRKIYGMSQTDLAQKTGLAQSTISRIEKGSKKTEIGTVFLILSVLNSDLCVVSRVKSESSSSLEGLF